MLQNLDYMILLRCFVYAIVLLTCYHPTQTPSLHSLYFPTFSTIQAVCRVFAVLFLDYFSHFYFLVVDRLLYLFLCSIYYLISPWDNIFIVFKNGSMVLQRTMYDPFLRAILIPNYTYF